jgi:hypothetical protein
LDVRNRWVHFRIRDVYYPEVVQVLDKLHGDDLLQGKVIDVSDSGDQSGAFVVVQVEEMEQPLVVSMRHILGVL